MDNIHDLANNIKRLAKNANAADEPMDVEYAEVVSVSPLKLDFGEYKVDESDDLLILSRTIKTLIEGKITLKHECQHTGSRVTQDFEIPGKLKKGDCVICLKEPGGESWVVIDIAEVDE